MSEIILEPLTEDQVAAIRELRFVFTNRARSVAIGLTTDPDVAARCPGGIESYTRSRNPRVVEYDVMMAHPQAVSLALEIRDASRNA